MHSETAHIQTCPYWSEISKTCSIKGNGLFIPLGSHVQKFCSSSKHCRSCKQHQHGRLHELSSKHPTQVNRRKYPRSPQKHAVLLTMEETMDSPGSAQLSDGYLIDVSLGGMQICTKVPLANNAIFLYQLKKNTPSEKDNGEAQVIWCRFHENDKSYHSGLSYVDDTNNIEMQIGWHRN